MQLKAEVNREAPGQELHSVASVLPLRGYRYIIPFMRLSMSVQKQLKATPGLVRFAMKTDIPRKRFWTFTVWTDRKAMGTFVRTEPHATAVKRFSEWGGAGAFAEWTGPEGKLDWKEAELRLRQPTFRSGDKR